MHHVIAFALGAALIAAATAIAFLLVYGGPVVGAAIVGLVLSACAWVMGSAVLALLDSVR